jgi:uncharacterized membrane protein YgdD (TMEM256/DUF423 family)
MMTACGILTSCGGLDPLPLRGAFYGARELVGALNPMIKWIGIAGALLAAIGVALGAFGAHGLENALRNLGQEEFLSKRAVWFDTAVRYQIYHSLALIALAALSMSDATSWHRIAAWLFIAGILLFSGSLYAMTFGPDEWRKLGMITPLGGLAFIAGWIAMAIAIWRS